MESKPYKKLLPLPNPIFKGFPQLVLPIEDKPYNSKKSYKTQEILDINNSNSDSGFVTTQHDQSTQDQLFPTTNNRKMFPNTHNTKNVQSTSLSNVFNKLTVEKHECHCFVEGCKKNIYNSYAKALSQNNNNTAKKKTNETKTNESSHFSPKQYENHESSNELTSVVIQQVKLQFSGLQDIAGLEDVKQNLREAILYPMKYPQFFTNGRTVWSSALMFGPPGVGKTALAQAIAAQANLPLYQVSSADLTSAWIGQSEKLIRRVFETLAEQRCILFLDEVDSLCRRRAVEDTAHSRKAATELLIQMQRYEGSAMFLLCATNCPWDIDTAFMRRFQKRIYVPLPDYEARKQILELNIKDVDWATHSTEWKNFINATEGLSGSDLKNLARSALMVPLREMHDNTHWVETELGRMIPTSKSNKRAIYCSLESIPDWKVWSRSLSMADLWTALDKTDKTVTGECLQLYLDFIKNHKII